MTTRRGLLADRPIVTRLVLRVATAMTAVLLLAGGFVFWRVAYALDRQLDQDLDAYRMVVERAVATGVALPGDTTGQTYQVYDERGRITAGDTDGRLLDAATVRQLAAGAATVRQDVGHLLPPADHPVRVVGDRTDTLQGPVVVATAISRAKHDEALRELLLQLLVADVATLAAAALVGYATARAALDPVERYRAAAARAGVEGTPHLPVPRDRDDELTRLVRTFNELLERIGRATQRERQFLADASHELRSPLTVMRTELEWALMQPQPEEARTALDSLRLQVERLIAVSNALLDLEELHADTAGTGDPVDVTALIGNVTVSMAGEAADQGRVLRYGAPQQLTVPGNEHWLELALRNLISNSLRHGTGAICISAMTHGHSMCLTVTDEGPGFPADFVAKAFDRFSRADTSRSSKGTGLGLALVQAVAEAHDGTTRIHGASVTVELPVGSSSH